MDKTSLGDRMKGYENVSNTNLTRRMPVIIRIDGNCFSKWTRGLNKPYDKTLQECFVYVAKKLLPKVQNSVLVYGQSDEISILLVDYEKLTTEPWFGKNIQKMVSLSASIATAYFNQIANLKFPADFLETRNPACFDSRVFVVPKEEVCNYFIWRQQDAVRNSIQSLARAYFSHRECNNKNQNDLQDMLFLQKNVNWNDEITWFKRGWCVRKEIGLRGYFTDNEIPIFTQDRDYIEKYVVVGD